jgi:t-SNARE complex subunit (syntaxin)
VKLKDTFQHVLMNMQNVSKASMQKQKELLAQERAKEQRAKEALIDASSTTGGSDSEAVETDALVVHNIRKQQQLRFQSEIQLNEAIIQEREEGIIDIEKSVREISHIMIQMSNMVETQGRDLDLMEDHIESAMTHTANATAELRKAVQYQKSSRKTMCCLLFIVLLIIGAIVIFFSVSK